MKINKYYILQKKSFLFGFLLFLVASIPVDSFAFQKDSIALSNSVQEIEKEKIEVVGSIREELHRYMGYEELLPKYISLPYDVVMSINIGGPFVDIGFLMLMFLPLLLILKLRNSYLKIATGVLMLMFLVISLSSGYRSHQFITADKVGEALEKEMEGTPFSVTPLFYLKLKITQIANTIYEPFHNQVINVFSGEGDAITYSIFLALFIILFLLLNHRLYRHPIGEQAIIYFLLMYGFLWLTLGSGVIWYGILLLPIGLVFISIGTINNTLKTSFIKYTFFLFVSIWLVNSLFYRMGNYSYPLSNEELGKSAIHTGPLLYGLEKINAEKLREVLYPNYGQVLKEINNNPDALVYRIGTYFQYFIVRNNERVFEDNQLGFFNVFIKWYPDKAELVKYLKNKGFRYIIADLNAASIDNTPDRTLKKKVNLLEKFLFNNPALQFIGTDAIVLNNEGEQVYSLSGRKLVKEGTFVAFKIK